MKLAKGIKMGVGVFLLLILGFAIGFYWKGQNIEKPITQKPHPLPTISQQTKDEIIAKLKIIKDSKKHTTEVASKDSHLPFNEYDRKQPVLMGIALQTHEGSVIDLFGEPNEKILLPDPDDPLTALEYAGFTVGIDEQKLVRFVEVSAGSVNPGLHELYVGQTTEDAVNALGTPDTYTDYVMSYHAEGTTLRLDIDPASNIIQSIKFYPTPKNN